MIETLALLGTIASITGVSLAKIRKFWVKDLEKDQIDQIMHRIEASKDVYSKGLIDKTISELYCDTKDYSLYTSISNPDVRLAFAMKNEWKSLEFDMLSKKVRFEFIGDQPFEPDIDYETTLTIIKEMEIKGINIWDAPHFNMASINLENGGINVKLTLSNYFKHRFGLGRIQDELINGIINEEQNVSRLVANKKQHLPVRSEVFPDLDSYGLFTKRITPVGANVLVAIRRQTADADDYALILQKRSKSVAEAPGILALVPSLNHQPMVDPNREVHIKASIWREIYEELFEGEEADKTSGHLVPNWYEKVSSTMSLITKTGISNMYLTGCGINLISGHFDFCALVEVRVPDFWDKNWYKLKGNWELSNSVVPVISSKDSSMIMEVLNRKDWASSSRVAFELGLRYLYHSKRELFEKIPILE